MFIIVMKSRSKFPPSTSNIFPAAAIKNSNQYADTKLSSKQAMKVALEIFPEYDAQMAAVQSV